MSHVQCNNRRKRQRLSLSSGRCFAVTLLVIVTACDARPDPTILKPVSVNNADRIVSILVAAGRAPTQDGLVDLDNDHPQELAFASYMVSIPATHRAGSIEWPGDPPDPETEFTMVKAADLSESQFRAAIINTNGSPRHVRLFVHGYNNSFQEAVFRLVQIAGDARDDRLPILFAWPSKGSVLAYSADRAAAFASRDDLARTIEILGEAKAQVVLLAHSMGGWLAMETLTQMSRDHRLARFVKSSRVVLAAPDIGVVEMVRQLEIIGKISKPLTVLVSRDDVALSLSALVTGGRRVGADDVEDPWVQAAAKRYGARVIDISGLEGEDRMRHARYTAMIALYAKIQEQIEDPDAPQYVGPGAFILDAGSGKLVPAVR